MSKLKKYRYFTIRLFRDKPLPLYSLKNIPGVYFITKKGNDIFFYNVYGS